jgi:hypothetical protein
MIAARLQERAVGGLDRDSLRFLHSLARQEHLPPRQLKTGTVREYQGRRHTVTTVRDGFDGREPDIPAFQRSHAPSPARPGAGHETRASLRWPFRYGRMVRLAVQLIIEEVLEAEARDKLGRERYERAEGEPSGSSAEILAQAANRYHAACTRRISVAKLGLPLGSFACSWAACGEPSWGMANGDRGLCER